MSVTGWALLLLVIGFAASPLVDAWLVKTHRISPWMGAVLIAARFPLFVALIFLIIGGNLLILAAIEVPLVLMAKGLFLPSAIRIATDIAQSPDAAGH